MPSLNNFMRLSLARVALLFGMLLVFGLPQRAVATELLVHANLGDIGKGWSRTWVDIDNDGRDDLCYLFGDWQQDLRCHMNKANGVREVLTVVGLWDGNGAPQTADWLDVNGDGYVDVCRAVQRPSPRIVCRKGPTFTPLLDLPITLAKPQYSCNEGGCTGNFVPGISSPGFLGAPQYFLVDVNGDREVDFCYLYSASELGTPGLRCRLGSVSADRTVVSFGAELPEWIRSSVTVAAVDWPQGFHDFNADGHADFCRRLPTGKLSCILSSASGFQPTEVSTANVVDAADSHGAGFVDFNGDGNTDFCRIASGNVLKCVLSNGRNWMEGSAERVSSYVSDLGNKYGRWWVDINGDGLLDYCRLASSPDPVGDWVKDASGTISCLLARGDAHNGGTIAFANGDISVAGLNLGVAEGGRSWCDATGTGMPTFCRVTVATTTASGLCYTNESGVEQCTEVPVYSTGYRVGLGDTAATAKQSLMESFTDGVGAETRITYSPLSSNLVYRTTSAVPSSAQGRLTVPAPRGQVVFETRAWTVSPNSATTPNTLTANARYMYAGLLSDRWSGSRGFRERWIYQEGSNTAEHVVYYQGLGPTVDLTSSLHDQREIGAPKCQNTYAVQNGLVPSVVNFASAAGPRRTMLGNIQQALLSNSFLGRFALDCGSANVEPSASFPFVLLKQTHNQLGETAPTNPRFKTVSSSKTLSWDWNGQARVAMPTVQQSTSVDDVGNVLVQDERTVDAKGLEWRRVTTNTYGQDNRSTWTLGRLTRSKVDSTAPSAAAQRAAFTRSIGTSEGAGLMQPAAPVAPTPQPLSPAVLAAILQLLLED